MKFSTMLLICFLPISHHSIFGLQYKNILTIKSNFLCFIYYKNMAKILFPTTYLVLTLKNKDSIFF